MQPFTHEPPCRWPWRDPAWQGSGRSWLEVSQSFKQPRHITPRHDAKTIPRHVVANELYQPGIAQPLSQSGIDFEREALDPARALIAPSVLEQVLDIDPEPCRQPQFSRDVAL